LGATEKAAREVLSLPMYPQLADRQLEQVCDSIQEWAATTH
jgi:dTDP-4-amino-4,6-dideoxygalactose transaminase